MKIYKDCSLSEFTPWNGGINTWNKIIKARKESEFELFITALYPDGLSEMDLNDLLWFESEWIFAALGIKEG